MNTREWFNTLKAMAAVGGLDLACHEAYANPGQVWATDADVAAMLRRAAASDDFDPSLLTVLARLCPCKLSMDAEFPTPAEVVDYVKHILESECHEHLD